LNAVEIEEAISVLAEQPFNAENFPYAFLEAFGNKETTIKRLRKGESNKSDLPGGVLQTNNIPGSAGHWKALRCGANPATLIRARQRESNAVRCHHQYLQGRRAFEDRIVRRRDIVSDCRIRKSRA